MNSDNPISQQNVDEKISDQAIIAPTTLDTDNESEALPEIISNKAVNIDEGSAQGVSTQITHAKNLEEKAKLSKDKLDADKVEREEEKEKEEQIQNDTLAASVSESAELVGSALNENDGEAEVVDKAVALAEVETEITGTTALMGLGLLGGLVSGGISSNTGSSSQPDIEIVAEDQPLIFTDAQDNDDATFSLDSSDTELNIEIDGTGGGRSFTLDAQNATQINVQGKLAQNADDEADTFTLTIDNIDDDSRSITFNASGIEVSTTGTGHKLVFDFSNNSDFAKDIIVLNKDSNVSAFSEIEVKSGTVSVLGVSLLAGTLLTVNSGIIISVEQFIATPSITSVSGDGAVTIQVNDDTELNNLQAFIGQLSDTAQILIGTNYSIDFDSYSGTLSADALIAQSTDIIAQLDVVTFPSIPEITTRLEALQVQIDNNDTDIIGLLTDASALQSAVTTLEALAGSESVADVKTSLDTAIATAKTELAAQITALDTDLQIQIDGNDTDIAGVLTDASTLQTAVTTLEALAGSESVADVKASLDTAITTAKTELAAQITALDTDLQAQIDGNDTDIANLTAAGTVATQSIADLNTAIKALEALQIASDDAASELRIALGTPANNSDLENSVAATGLYADIDALEARILELEGPIGDWADKDAINVAVDQLFEGDQEGSNDSNDQLDSSITAENVIVGIVAPNIADAVYSSSNSTSIYLSDLDANSSFIVPSGSVFLSMPSFLILNMYGAREGSNINENIELFDAGSVVTLPQSETFIVPTAFNVWAATNRTGLDELLAYEYYYGAPIEIRQFVVSPPRVADFLSAQQGRDAGNEIAADFITLYDGFDPATVTLDITNPITVAQAVALVEAGFDLAHHVKYSVVDFASTLQAANANLAQLAVLENASLVTAEANELDNNLDMAAFDGAVNLRTELGNGNDSFNAGRGHEQIVGGGGADVINLTKNDYSQDSVIFEDITDGESIPVTEIRFSDDPSDYREGSVLTFYINGHEYSHTVSSDDGDTTIDSGLITSELNDFADMLTVQTVIDSAQTLVGYLFDDTNYFGGYGEDTDLYGEDTGMPEVLTLADIPADGIYTVPVDKIFIEAGAVLVSNQYSDPSIRVKTAGDIIHLGQNPVFDISGLQREGLYISDEFVLLDYLSVSQDKVESLIVESLMHSPMGPQMGFYEAKAQASEIATLITVGKGGSLSGIEVNYNGLVLFGQIGESLEVLPGEDYESTIVNPGLATSIDVKFSSFPPDYPSNTNPGKTTEFEREISIIINDTKYSAVVKVEDPDKSVSNLKAVLDEEIANGTLSDVLSSVSLVGTQLTLVGSAIPDTDSDAPTFIVNSISIDVRGVQQQTDVEFSSDNNEYYLGGSISVKIAGQTIQVSMVDKDAVASVSKLSGHINDALSLTPSKTNATLIAALESAEVLSNSSTTLRFVSATEEAAPTLVDASLSYIGEVQQSSLILDTSAQYSTYTNGTELTDASRTADVYFDGGQAHVTIGALGEDSVSEVTVSVGMGADSDDTTQDLVFAINEQINGVDAVEGAAVITLDGDNDFSAGMLISDARADEMVVLKYTIDAGEEVTMSWNGESSVESSGFWLEGYTVDTDDLGSSSNVPVELTDLLTYISTIEGIDTAKVENGDVIITSTATGADTSLSFSLAIQASDWNTAVDGEDNDSYILNSTATGVTTSEAIEPDTILSSLLSSAELAADGTITLTALEPGKETFEITETSLDYQGVQQLASVTFSIADGAYYTGGTLSLTIDTTPDVAGDTQNNVTIISAMADGNAALSKQNLVAEVNSSIENSELLSGLLGPVTETNGTLTFTSIDAAKHAFDISDAQISYAGIKQQVAIQFSDDNSDYFNDSSLDADRGFGFIGATINTVEFEQQMIDGSYADTVAALQLKIQNAVASSTLEEAGAIFYIQPMNGFKWGSDGEFNNNFTNWDGNDNVLESAFVVEDFSLSVDRQNDNISSGSNLINLEASAYLSSGTWTTYWSSSESYDSSAYRDLKFDNLGGFITYLDGLRDTLGEDLLTVSLSDSGDLVLETVATGEDVSAYLSLDIYDSYFEKDNDGVDYSGLTSDEKGPKAVSYNSDAEGEDEVEGETLLSDIGDVSIEGSDTIIITAKEPSDESVITIDNVFTNVAGVKQVTEVDFSALQDSDFYVFGDDNDKGFVSLDIAGFTVTIPMTSNKADTMASFIDKIEYLRDSNGGNVNIHEAVGTVGITGDILTITAKDVGEDQLDVSNFVYTTPFVNGQTNEVRISFGSYFLTEQDILDEVITITIAGVTTELVIDNDLLGSFDDGLRADGIIQALLDKITTEHGIDDEGISSTNLGFIKKTETEDGDFKLSFIANERGVGTLGDVSVQITIDDNTGINSAAAILATVNSGVNDIESTAISDDIIINQVSGQGAAVSGMYQSTLTNTTGPVVEATGELSFGVIKQGDDDAPIEQNITNPGFSEDDNANYFGDANYSAVTGDKHGIQQTFTNPDNGYDAIIGSAQANDENNDGDFNLFGSEPGNYKDEGIESDYLNGGVIDAESGLYIAQGILVVSDLVDIFDGSAEGGDSGIVGESSTLLTDSNSTGEDGFGSGMDINIDDQGFTDFFNNDASYWTLEGGSEGYDVINNFQVKNFVGADNYGLNNSRDNHTGDSIELGGALLASTQGDDGFFDNTDSRWVYSQADEATSFASTDDNLSYANVISFDVIGISDSTSEKQIKITNLGEFRYHSGTTESNQSKDSWEIWDGTQLEGQTYADINELEIALNNTRSQFGDQPYQSLVVNVVYGEIENSVRLEISVSGPDPLSNFFFSDAEVPAYQLNEFLQTTINLSEQMGVVVSSSDNAEAVNSLSVDELTDVSEVAQLLNTLFDTGYTDDNEHINTSVFAITAADDATQTAIWTHTQSSTDDDTIDAHELNLLAMVNTTGGEFNSFNLSGEFNPFMFDDQSIIMV